MRSLQKGVMRQVKNIDFDTRYDQMSRHLRRKADALQARRWRKLNRQIDRSPYLDSQIKHRGGIL